MKPEFKDKPGARSYSDFYKSSGSSTPGNKIQSLGQKTTDSEELSEDVKKDALKRRLKKFRKKD